MPIHTPLVVREHEPATQVRGPSGRPIRTLRVGAAEDRAERNADALADQLVGVLAARSSEAAEALSAPSTTRIRRSSTLLPVAVPPVAPDSAGVIRRDWRIAAAQNEHHALDSGALGKKYRANKMTETTTLHHHVSRVTMSDVASSWTVANRSKNKRLTKAAQEFNSAVFRALGAFSKDQPRSLDKALHNLPFNLHFGPTKVSGNPGSSFDPSTELGPGGTRVETKMTVLLRRFQDTYSAAMVNGIELTAGTWEELTEIIEAANTLWVAEGKKIETSEEQWMLADETTNVWIKKGLLTLRDFDIALRRFNKEDTYMGAETGGVAANLVGHVVQPLVFTNGDVIEVVVYFDDAGLDHFCNRHTFRYFDFAGIKAVNVFWPPATDRNALAATVNMTLATMGTDIEREVQFDPDADTDEFDNQVVGTISQGKGLKQTTPDGRVYYAVEENANPPAGFPPAGPNTQYTHYVRVDMFAPSGPTFEAFEKPVLQQMVKCVDRNSER